MMKASLSATFFDMLTEYIASSLSLADEPATEAAEEAAGAYVCKRHPRKEGAE